MVIHRSMESIRFKQKMTDAAMMRPSQSNILNKIQRIRQSIHQIRSQANLSTKTLSALGNLRYRIKINQCRNTETNELDITIYDISYKMSRCHYNCSIALRNKIKNYIQNSIYLSFLSTKLCLECSSQRCLVYNRNILDLRTAAN